MGTLARNVNRLSEEQLQEAYRTIAERDGDTLDGASTTYAALCANRAQTNAFIAMYDGRLNDIFDGLGTIRYIVANAARDALDKAVADRYGLFVQQCMAMESEDGRP